MTDNSIRRQLKAIFTADVKGYSRLMGDDDESTFAYKNKFVKVQRIAEDLGFRYVLEGSVQRSNDRVRVTAQLIDATAGHHLWADSYDRKIDDIFSLQDEFDELLFGGFHRCFGRLIWGRNKKG